MLNDLKARVQAVVDDVILSVKEFVGGIVMSVRGVLRCALALPKAALVAVRDAVRKLIGE